jgi:hypothetical protein
MIPPIGLWIMKSLFKIISIPFVITMWVAFFPILMFITTIFYLFNRMNYKDTFEFIFEAKKQPEVTPWAMTYKYLKWLIMSW